MLLFAAQTALAAQDSPADVGDCRKRLVALGAQFESPRIPVEATGACEIADPVALTGLSRPQRGASIRFPGRPLLACALAERLAGFTLETLAPLALRAFDREIIAVASGPGFECRPRNRQPGAKMSSHGNGLALDIARIDLAGSRAILVARPNGEAETRFLADFRTAACTAFNTVLGPGADAFHSDHIHLDLEPRGKTGIAKFCQ